MTAGAILPFGAGAGRGSGICGKRKSRVGDILIRLRRERNLSQEELARDLGISASYLSLLENGKRPVTSRVLRTLAGYLRVPAGYLVLQNLRLEDLSERHQTVVKELRRELMIPAFEDLFPGDPPPTRVPVTSHLATHESRP